MCGIIGIFGKNCPDERAKQSLEKIQHRGSSTYELRYFPEAVFGANRLPIVGRETGTQPISNEDGTIFATQNGEIFNYKTLKSELETTGHIFKTDTDTEVLAHLYEAYDAKMIDKIDSEMFAFIIYDTKNHSVFAARDALGVKPLYYAKDTSGQIYFASELKQLVIFPDILEVREFPPGHYFYNGKFVSYSKITTSNTYDNEKFVVSKLQHALVEAVRKRVDTDLPIGVFLSGGVDSSLIMEIASRLHKDVTAIILGFPGSPDYEFSLRLCKDRGYKYHIVEPHVDFEKELDNAIYYSETFEPLIIRHAFSLDICAREAKRLGLKVILGGEGADELFAGYNEFSSLPDKQINRGCKLLLESLHNGHLQRVDRMSMKHTIEVRNPFFDKEIVRLASNISGHLKVRRINHQVITKYILRVVATSFLPDYIAWRYKVPFSNGAGMNVGNNYKSSDGDVARITDQKNITISEEVKKQYAIQTKEEAYYLSKYIQFGFNKLKTASQRLVVKDTLSELYKSKHTRLIVAEFDRLAIYFPVYFAAAKKMYALHKLDVDFVATGGDDVTFGSLVNNSAHIGLSDPLFAMFENKTGVKGEIIGELVQHIPNVAVTFNPNIHITNTSDFKKYSIGTFQKYTTTHTVISSILPEGTKITPFNYKELIDKLTERKIDIAVLLPEQALELVPFGGRVIYDFNKKSPFLFSGFTIVNTLEEKYRQKLPSFLAATRESVRYIIKHKQEALDQFSKMFPELHNKEAIFSAYLDVWSQTLELKKEDYAAAHKTWKKEYPEMLHEYKPYFYEPTIIDTVVSIINKREYRRDFPFLEDVLREKIQYSLTNNVPLQLIGFWGAGSKTSMDDSDVQLVENMKRYCQEISTVFPAGVQITFILSDAHARMNGYKKLQYTAYLYQVERYLKKQGFHVLRLESLWKKWGMSKSSVEKELVQKNKNWWSAISIAEELEEQAQKRHKKKDPVKGAQLYYIMRSLEKSHIETNYPNSIFFTFTDSRTQSVYPTQPTLYLYTLQRGVSDLPWFTVPPLNQNKV